MVLNYGWEFGGGEMYAFSLGEVLEGMGHKVCFFSSDNGNSLYKLKSDYYFPESKFKFFKIFTSVFNPISLFYFRKALLNFRPDIVHIHSISGEVTPSITLALNNTPTIMTLHSKHVF